VLEVFLIPLTATLLIPMSFSEMWMTLCYTLVRPLSLLLPASLPPAFLLLLLASSPARP